MQSLRLPARLDSLEQFRAFVADTAKREQIPSELVPKLELVLEELLTNLVFHAYKGNDGSAEVQCSAEGGTFCLRFVDEGPPFDPLKRPPPDLSKPLEQRQIGGLGIHLVKNMADRLEDRRDRDRNILTVCFDAREAKGET